MSFYVYLIITKRLNRYITYVGYTNNIDKRINLHNSSKGARFTKGSKWTLIFKKKFNSKNIAMKEEYKLKKDFKKRNRIKNFFLTKHDI